MQNCILLYMRLYKKETAYMSVAASSEQTHLLLLSQRAVQREAPAASLWVLVRLLLPLPTHLKKEQGEALLRLEQQREQQTHPEPVSPQPSTFPFPFTVSISSYLMLKALVPLVLSKQYLDQNHSAFEQPHIKCCKDFTTKISSPPQKEQCK